MQDVPLMKRTNIDTSISFWPGFVDMLTSVLMIVLLLYLLQTLIVDSKARKIRQKQEQFEEIFRQALRDDLKEKRVGISLGQNLVQIIFSEDVLFDIGKYELKPAAKPLLDRCAGALKKAGESGYTQIQVEGHTDSRPLREGIFPKDNWDLSVGRAVSVLKYLTGKEGLDPDAHRPILNEKLFSASGYADTQPAPALEKYASDDPLAKDRRIEILVFFEKPKRKSL